MSLAATVKARRLYTVRTMPCVSATMTPRISMNATHAATSRTVSRCSAALVCGGRKNSAGSFFMRSLATTTPFGSRNVGAVGAGHGAQHHERNDQQNKEGDLEDDEPGAQSHEFEAPSRNRHLVVEVIVEFLLLGQDRLLGSNGCPAPTFGVAGRMQRGPRDGKTIQAAESLEMVETANRWLACPIGDQVGPHAHDADGPEQGDATAVAPLEDRPDTGIVGPPAHCRSGALDREVPDVVDRNRKHQHGFEHAPAESCGHPLTQP